ncbi:MAG TPA: thiamine diphosphokinase [Acidimicrobiia bacterium]|nr:thiamine diphosphokinase [Acidimicrobiia bacterium]
MTTVLVVTGGDRVPAEATSGLLPADFVVAADSGLDHAELLGIRPDVVVGDFDSVSVEALERFDGPVERHPVAKDATDLELALRLAIARQPDRIVVIGGHGGRLDHFLANALVLTTVPAAIDVEWRAGGATIHVVRSRTEVEGSAGATISLVPVGGDVHGVTTRGLRWPLTDATLTSGSTLGVSNEFAERTAQIEVDTGTLLVVVPGQS